MAEPVLAVRDVAKAFGPVRALTEVNLELHPGEVVALIGDNGAGKSTLVKCLSGIYPPDEGTIEIDGEAVELRSPQDASTRSAPSRPRSSSASTRPSRAAPSSIRSSSIDIRSREKLRST